MNTALRAVALLVGCVSLAACAAPKHRNSATTASLQINTKPAGASVQPTNGTGCQPTPCSIQTPAKAEVTATVRKAGYKPAHVKVSHGFLGLRPKKVTVALKPDLTEQAASRPPLRAALAPAPNALASDQSGLAAALLHGAGLRAAAGGRSGAAGAAPAPRRSPPISGRVIALRVLLDGAILETHSPYD